MQGEDNNKYDKARADHDRSGIMGPIMQLNDIIEYSIPKTINALPDTGNEMVEIHKGLVFMLVMILILFIIYKFLTKTRNPANNMPSNVNK